MKKNVLFAIAISILWTSSVQAEPMIYRPYWSLEVKGGRFISDIETWSRSYGDRYTEVFGASLAYKVLRQLDIGIEGESIRDTGTGMGEAHQTPAGDATINLYPLNVFVVARGIFNDNQWVVPYVGGGWTRMFYKTEIQHQGVARGSADGYHARGGIQLLLDALDPHAANNLYRDYGIYHTYLFIEATSTRAMVNTAGTPSESVNLGGTSWQAGFLFEF